MAARKQKVTRKSKKGARPPSQARKKKAGARKASVPTSSRPSRASAKRRAKPGPEQASDLVYSDIRAALRDSLLRRFR